MIPRWSFSALLVTAALLPWYVVRWQIAGIPTTLLEVAILLTIGMWAAEKTIRREWQGFLAFVRQKRIFFGLIALFVVSACIEAFISPSHREALGILKAYILEPVLFLLVAVDSISVNPKGWWWLVGALWLAGLQVMLVSVSQTLWHWPNLAPAELAQGRASSFYNTANAVGLFLGPLLGLAIGALLSGQLKRWTMMLLTLWAGLGLLVIGLSHSRGAFLGCAAVAAVFGSAWVIRRSGLTMSSKTTRSLAIGMVILYAALSLGYVWFVNNPPKVANPYTRPGFSTLTVRQCLWQGTKNLLDDSPLLGAGLSGFSAAYLPHSTCDAEPLVYPHLLVLNFWSELGMMGVLAMLAIISWYLVLASGYMHRADGWYWVGVGMVAAMTYWLIHGLDDVPYFKNDLSVEWWLLCALVLLWPLFIGRVDLVSPKHLPEQS